eukprot:536562_1
MLLYTSANVAEKFNISRQQDQFSMLSQKLAAAATANGKFAPITIQWKDPKTCKKEDNYSLINVMELNLYYRNYSQLMDLSSPRVYIIFIYLSDFILQHLIYLHVTVTHRQNILLIHVFTYLSNSNTSVKYGLASMQLLRSVWIWIKFNIHLMKVQYL